MSDERKTTTVTIVHFNDVYNIEPRDKEPVAGAARFVTAIRRLADRNPLILFSGDLLSPSPISSIAKGHQMVPIMNAIGVHCSVYGNHEFDHGVDNLVEVAEKTNCTWLLSNVIDIQSKCLLGNGKATLVITRNGKKIGLIGLIEENWIETLSVLNAEDLKYLDFVDEGRRLALELKGQGVDYVIALTHMRWSNDERLAREVPEIDLILGGHDHDYGVRKVNGRLVVKSGTDFRQFALINLVFDDDHEGKVEPEVTEFSIDSTIPEDVDTKKIVDEYSKKLEEAAGGELDTVVGQFGSPMDGRYEYVRTQETSLGNFLTNVMLTAHDADVALINAGTIRSNEIHEAGDFRLRDLIKIMPMQDSLVVVEVTGAQLMAALENGVSKYPSLEGRFPQVAGLVFKFDPDLEPGSRVEADSVFVQGEPIDVNRKYSLATTSYVTSGGDGYDCLSGLTYIVDVEKSIPLLIVVQNFFKSVQIVQGNCTQKYHHRQSTIPLNRRKSLIRQMTVPNDDETDSGFPVDEVDGPPTKALLTRCLSKNDAKKVSLRRQLMLEAEAREVHEMLAPGVQSRICLANRDGEGRPKCEK